MALRSYLLKYNGNPRPISMSDIGGIEKQTALELVKNGAAVIKDNLLYPNMK